MNIDDHSYIWEDDSEFVLLWIENNEFAIINYVDNSYLLIDHEELEKNVILKMLTSNKDIYMTFSDCLNRTNNISNSRRQEIIDSYRNKEINISIRWSHKKSLAMQISKLKELYPRIGAIDSKKILSIAKENERWNLGKML